MTGTPLADASTESTTTVVIGSGFSGLAVASELSRQGVRSIVLDGFPADGGKTARSAISARSALPDRSDILRVLVHYAQSHHLDIRTSTEALALTRGAAGSGGRRWVVHTKDGLLLADSIVLTRGAQNQLRRLVSSIGIILGRDVGSAMRAVGIYLVGIGDLITPSTQDIIRQAKLVSESISAATAIA